MKKIITLSLIILIVVACNTSNESKAKKLIKEYLKTNMNDFSSYEPVEFSKLDSLFSNFEETEKAISIDNHNIDVVYEQTKECSEKLKTLDRNSIEYELYSEVYDQNLQLIKKIEEVDSLRKLFKPEHIGYAISHKFRGKNGFGAIILSEENFYFNRDLTKVTDYDGYKLEKSSERIKRLNEEIQKQK